MTAPARLCLSPPLLLTGSAPQCCPGKVQGPFPLCSSRELRPVKASEGWGHLPQSSVVKEPRTSTQIIAAAGPRTQTWPLVVAQAQASPWRQVANRTPTWADLPFPTGRASQSTNLPPSPPSALYPTFYLLSLTKSTAWRLKGRRWAGSYFQSSIHVLPDPDLHKFWRFELGSSQEQGKCFTH